VHILRSPDLQARIDGADLISATVSERMASKMKTDPEQTDLPATDRL
jgi:hypothetical protein